MGNSGPPVFIFGVPRSGTTLLYRTLLRHPFFAPRNPTPVSFFVESKVFQFADDHNRFLRLFMGANEEVYARFLAGTRMRRAVNRLYRSPVCRNWMERRSPATRALLWRRLGQAGLIRSFFVSAREAQGCDRVLEKTPIHYKFLPEIRASFPDAPCLWIHRHPVDVFASFRRRGRDERDQQLTPTEGLRWLSVTPDMFMERYREGIAAMEHAVEAEPSKHHSLSYEALVLDPERVFGDVCAFLGIPFEVACVRGGDASVDDPRDPMLSKPIHARTKNWIEFLSPEEAHTVQHGLRTVMEKLGYSIYDAESAAAPEPA